MVNNLTSSIKTSIELGLFVYGTLRNRQNSLEQREQGKIQGHLLNCGHFPAFIPDPNGIDIIGEIIEDTDDYNLRRLDRYEGYQLSDPEGSLYIRTTIDVRTKEDVRRCWVYVFNQDYSSFTEITSGDWFNRGQ